MNTTQNANYILGLMWAGLCTQLTTFPCEDWEDLAPGEAEHWLGQIVGGIEYLDARLNDACMYSPCTRAR